MKWLNFYFLLFIYLSCNNISYHQMATEDPKGLLLLEDSLKSEKLNKKTIKALITAHNTIGLSELNNNNIEKAKNHFSNTLIYSANDTLARYNLLIIQGHLLKKSGKKEKLWNAIQAYHKAAQLKPYNGDPYFFIAESYKKIGDKEFDLILESYKKALELDLSPQIKKIATTEYALILDREKKLKEFWK